MQSPKTYYITFTFTSGPTQLPIEWFLPDEKIKMGWTVDQIMSGAKSNMKWRGIQKMKFAVVGEFLDICK